MLLAVPGPPLRESSSPAWRLSKSVMLAAPLRATACSSSTVTSASTSVKGCGVRVAVTTVSGSVATEAAGSTGWAALAA